MSSPEWPSPLTQKPKRKIFRGRTRHVEDRWALWGAFATIAVAVVVSTIGARSAHNSTQQQVQAIRDQIAAESKNLDKQIEAAKENLNAQLADARIAETESQRRDSLRAAWIDLLDVLLHRRDNLDKQASAIQLAATNNGLLRDTFYFDWTTYREQYEELESSSSVATAVVRLSASQAAHLCISAYEDFLTAYYLDVLLMGNAMHALPAEELVPAESPALHPAWREVADDADFYLNEFARLDIVLNGNDPGGALECRVPSTTRFPARFDGF